MLELLPFHLLGRKRSLLGGRHLDLFLLDLLHQLGCLGGGNLLPEAEVGSFEGEHLCELPALALATALGLHGLELGLLLLGLRFLPRLFLVMAETLNWGCNLRRTSESGHAMTAEHRLGLRVMTGDIPLTEETQHKSFHPFFPVIY